jgi:hypothetical protein
MNYDTMEAGREMDALVAEKVMGWKKRVRKGHGVDGNHEWWFDKRKPTYPLEFVKGWDTDEDFDPWEPSTSISAAWEVVECFERGGFAPWGEQVAAAVELSCSDGIEKERYFCTFYSPSLAKVEAFGKTMPEAVCRAALKAVGKEGRKG